MIFKGKILKVGEELTTNRIYTRPVVEGMINKVHEYIKNNKPIFCPFDNGETFPNIFNENINNVAFQLIDLLIDENDNLIVLGYSNKLNEENLLGTISMSGIGSINDNKEVYDYELNYIGFQSENYLSPVEVIRWDI